MRADALELSSWGGVRNSPGPLLAGNLVASPVEHLVASPLASDSRSHLVASPVSDLVASPVADAYHPHLVTLPLANASHPHLVTLPVSHLVPLQIFALLSLVIVLCACDTYKRSNKFDLSNVSS